jgi:regulator of replication initiation timing
MTEVAAEIVANFGFELPRPFLTRPRMTPLEFHKSVQELLQWDADRLTALLTGLIFGGVSVWWFLRRNRTARSSEDYKLQRTDQELADLRANVRGLTEDKHRLEQEKQALKNEVTRLKREPESIELDRIEDETDTAISPLDEFPGNEKAGIAKKKRAYLVGEGTHPRRVDRLVKVHDFKGKAIYVYFLVPGKMEKANPRNVEQQIAMYRQVGHEVTHPEKPFEDVSFWVRHGRAEAARFGFAIG